MMTSSRLFVQNASEPLDRGRFVNEGYVVVRDLFTPMELHQLQAFVDELPSLDGPIQTMERVKGVALRRLPTTTQG